MEFLLLYFPWKKLIYFIINKKILFKILVLRNMVSVRICVNGHTPSGDVNIRFIVYKIIKFIKKNGVRKVGDIPKEFWRI